MLAGCPGPVAGAGETGSESSSGGGATTGEPGTTGDTPTTGDMTTTTTGEPASSSSESSTGAPEPVCGDGVVGGEELCDDGMETPDDDGCDAKCKPNAVVLWTQSWDGALKDDDAEGLAVDGAGNIYVAGSTTKADLQVDAVVRKLDATGKEVQSFAYVGPAGLNDVARSIAVDADGNIYVAGIEEFVEKQFRGWARKYDPTGKQLWVYERNAEVMDGDAVINKIVLDGDAAYILGSEVVGDLDTSQYFLQRLGTTDGKPTWTAIVDDAVGTYRLGLAVGPDGELLVAGGVIDPMNDERQPWVGKFSAAGKLLWSQTGYLAGGGFAMGAAVGPNGELAVTGLGYQFNDYNVWVASLDPTGAVIWEDYISTEGYDVGHSVAFGAGGELYLGGYVNSTSELSNTLVRRYTPAGLPYWTDKYNDAIDLYDGVGAVLVTPTMIVAAGSESVAKHGSNQWIRAYAP